MRVTNTGLGITNNKSIGYQSLFTTISVRPISFHCLLESNWKATMKGSLLLRRSRFGKSLHSKDNYGINEEIRAYRDFGAHADSVGEDLGGFLRTIV